MLRRLLSLLLILCLICTAFPAFSEDEDDMYAIEDEVYAYRTLKRGDRDGDDSSAVLTLQNRLIELGYLNDAADGIYGGNTEAAITILQRSNNMAETGEATPQLQELLFSGADVVSFADSNEPESINFRVQSKLALWGFYGGSVNGADSDESKSAIDEFRDYLPGYNELHPAPTPEPGSEPEHTQIPVMVDMPIVMDIPLDAEEEDEDEGSSGLLTEEMMSYIDGNQEFDVYRETVANGDQGQEVRRVQRRLYQLKYLAVPDGVYGADTERALLYFQKKNNIPQSAVADEQTQRLLFSEDAMASEEFVNAYKIIVDVSDQRVYIYQWDGSTYSTQVKEMICSTGKLTKSTATPLGTYQAAGPTGTGEWYWFSYYRCYAKWATRIVGGILFHSVTYSKKKKLNTESVRKLGRPASHGCVRLEVENAKWIYENCAAGTTVVIQE